VCTRGCPRGDRQRRSSGVAGARPLELLHCGFTRVQPRLRRWRSTAEEFRRRRATVQLPDCHLLRTADSVLPTTYYIPPTTYYVLPTTSYIVLRTHNILRPTYSARQTTYHIISYCTLLIHMVEEFQRRGRRWSYGSTAGEFQRCGRATLELPQRDVSSPLFSQSND